MRLRYISVTYAFGGTTPSLDRHYRELREAMLHPAQHYTAGQPAAWRPPMDIHETQQAIIVKAELAGMAEEAIDIALYDNALVITGQREDDSDHAQTAYYHEAQVRYGPFRAEIVLPAPIQREACEATYQNGFLRVTLPKAATADNADGQTGASPHRQAPRGDGHQLASNSVTLAPTTPATITTTTTSPQARSETGVPPLGEQ
jgi:HSP20 family molecular chaperone IbpA